jgi:hypothetical protein
MAYVPLLFSLKKLLEYCQMGLRCTPSLILAAVLDLGWTFLNSYRGVPSYRGNRCRIIIITVSDTVESK